MYNINVNKRKELITMEIKTTYVAFDGKEFDDEDLCFEYEGKTRYPVLLGQAKFYDRRGNKIILQDIIFGYNNAYFVDLPTEETVKQYKELEKAVGNAGADNINKPGFYFYEETHGKYWHKVKDFPEFIADEYDSYRIAKKIKEQLDNEN